MIKTFRGLIVDGGIDTIVLHTNDGSTGYRIKKLDIFPAVQDSAKDNLVCVSKVLPAAAITTADFSDNTLLGAAIMFFVPTGNPNQDSVVIFDREIFNQDIYISNVDSVGSNSMNYYLELEQVKLDLNESTVATLKDIRNKELRTMIA